VGKSTLIGSIIAKLRERGRTVGVLAVDPSSKRSGGAVLGDRIRFGADPEDSGVFIRSMAARNRLGGLADHTVAAMVLLRGVYDVVVLETVGVGQSETDVAGVADTVVFCVQPGAGDSLQFMKAGIGEIPHIIVVTKSDLGAPATRALGDLRGASELTSPREDGWQLACLAVSALRGSGIKKLLDAVERHGAWLAQEGRVQAARHAQAEAWLIDAVRTRFGTEGLTRAGPLALTPGESPFGALARLAEKLSR
jgi:LAO/AO transport system kinase